MVTTIQPSQVTFFKHPILATQLLVEVIAIKVKQIVQFSIRFWYLLLILAATLWAVFNLESLRTVKEIGWFSLYWILLGVASSIGLGTGLHTFVLYLGPHIAKVVVASIDCGYVPEMIPSRWNFSYFKECSVSKTSEISVLQLIAAVQIEAFLWGLGTAIGQLPPYYISREAAITADKLAQHEKNKKKGQSITDEQQIVEMKRRLSQTQEQIQAIKKLEQLQNLKNKSQKELTKMQKVKLFFYDILKKHGFITILLLASVPNPLFDLAGITCGHFKIPFITFFSATMIGKAIIKVHIQVLFIIFLFSQHHVESVLKMIQSWFPFLQNKLLDAMQKQKRLLFQPQTYSSQKSVIGKVWDYFLIGMILYFVLSIIHNSIQHHLLQKQTKQEAQKQVKRN